MRIMSSFWGSALRVCAILGTLCPSVAAASDATDLPAAVGERLEIIRLLKAEDFKELEVRFAKVAAVAETNPSVVWNEVYTLSAFVHADPELVGPLTRWRESHPKSFAPYLAFGLYSAHIGWVMRGEKQVRYTNPARFVEMRTYFDAATDSLRTALKYNPKIDVAWERLINMAKAQGDHRAMDAYFTEALTHLPKSSWIYGAYYNALAPEWGGSAAQQFALRARLQGMFSYNPDFDWVANVEDERSAWDLYWKDKNAEALARFDELIDRGGGLGSRRGRAFALRDLRKYDEAVAEFRRVVEMDSANPKAYFELAAVQALRKDGWADARRNMDIALMLDPYDPPLLVGRADFLMKHGKLDAAKRDLDRALFFGALDDGVRDALRRYYWAIKDMNAAVSEAEKMVSLVPGNPKNQ